MEFLKPPQLKPGDRVAIVSPSSGIASLYPWVYQLGLKRLREEFLLEPVEFPTALQTPEFLEKNPKSRADDINAAFKDDRIKAIIATTGGNDQIRILPFLDSNVIKSHPKPFFGYSDNTNLHLHLWNLGFVSYYGGSVMSQLGMQGKMHDFTIKALKNAFFGTVTNLEFSPLRTDIDLDWSDPDNLTKQVPLIKSESWKWVNERQDIIKGRLWGGCLEILTLHLAVKHYLPNFKSEENTILYVETSEEMPNEGCVYRFFAMLGELDLLKHFKAVLVGFPKTQFCGQLPPGGAEQYLMDQQSAILKGLKDYGANPQVIFNLNFGHTEPQAIIPNGAIAEINNQAKTIQFLYN